MTNPAFKTNIYQSWNSRSCLTCCIKGLTSTARIFWDHFYCSRRVKGDPWRISTSWSLDLKDQSFINRFSPSVKGFFFRLIQRSLCLLSWWKPFLSNPVCGWVGANSTERWCLARREIRICVLWWRGPDGYRHLRQSWELISIWKKPSSPSELTRIWLNAFVLWKLNKGIFFPYFLEVKDTQVSLYNV